MAHKGIVLLQTEIDQTTTIFVNEFISNTKVGTITAILEYRQISILTIYSWINNSNWKKNPYEPIHKLNAKTFFQGSEYFFLFGQKQLLQNMQSHKNAPKYTIVHNNICSAYKEHLLESDRKKIFTSPINIYT